MIDKVNSPEEYPCYAQKVKENEILGILFGRTALELDFGGGIDCLLIKLLSRWFSLQDMLDLLTQIVFFRSKGAHLQIKKKKEGKIMKKNIAIVVGICLFLMVIASCACADVDYVSKISQVYSACLKKNGGNSYNGWCGRYVLHQLEVNGINYIGSGTFNGNEIYYNMVDGATTSSGYVQKKFAGNDALYNIVNQYGSKVENIVVSFKHQYGYTDSNPGAGHTNFIYAISDGMVWFSESYTGSLGNEGSPIHISLTEYMRRYNSSYGNIIGAVYYMPGYTSIRKVDEYYLCNGVTLDPSTQATHYGFTLESLFGKGWVDGYNIPYDESEGNNISPDHIPVQAIIHVVEVVENNNGVQWYKADQISYYMDKDGDGEVEFYVDPENLFIKPEDVAYQYKRVSITPGIYVVTEPNQTQWGRAPFDAHDNGTAILNGEEVNVVGAVENKYHNIWYQLDSLSSEKWVYSGHLGYVRTNVTVNVTVNNAIPGEGLPKTAGDGIPTGNLPKGQSYELRGTVTASENIQSITGTIYNLNTDAVVSGIGTNPITINPNRTSVDIFTSQVNYSLKFNYMNDGAYRYVVDVTTVSGYNMTIIDSTFTIGTGILPDIAPDPENTWVYQVVTTDGINIRAEANTSSSIIMTMFNPTTFTVTEKTTAGGYTWGYGTTSTGYTGWAVVDNDWTELISGPTMGTDITVSWITLNQTALNLTPGGTFYLTATVSPNNATNKTVNWTTSDSSVATISDNGLVSAVASGTVTITATAADGSEKTATCSINVYKPTSGGAIYVYNQWDTKYKSKALSGGNNMHTSGCGIFSMAHAYQWLSKDSLNQGQADGLLDALIGVYNTPWVGDLSQYYNYMISNSVMLKHEGKYSSEAQYQSLFNNGGCVLLHPQGHYSLAVGMTHRDLNNDGIDETYVHVIDSVISATLGRWNDAGTYWTSHGYSAYYISSFSKMNPNTSNCGHGKEFGQGGEYWLDYQSFSSIAQRCLWPAEQIQPADTLEFRNVQYPDPFKINTTQGWYLGSGTVVSNANLTSIRSILAKADASWSQDTGEISISGHSFAIATRSFDQQVKFSQLTTEGNYIWRLIAKDDQNRVLSMTIPFYVSATQSTNSDHTISKSYVKLIESIDPIFEEGELIHLGEIGTVYPRIYPEDATNQNVIWESSNQAVLTIDNAGNYETHSTGETDLTCYATDGSGIKSQTVHVRVGHSCEWVLSIEPSALHDGLRENKCAVCGFVEDSEVIPSFAGKCYNDPDFITPGGLMEIDEEAFSGIGAEYVKLSNMVASIGKNAFANCAHLKQILIPSSVTFIGENAIPNTGNIDIVGFKYSEAENYALNHSINFIALDDDLFEWVPIESVPENAVIVNTKTQYSFREKEAGSYTEWSAWSAWSEFTQQITDDNLKQMESKTQCRWWAAKCSSCGQNNPYHATNCKNCGTYLDSNQEGSVWISVFAYSDDTSGTQTILGRSQGRYFDGVPYWNTGAQPTVYRYRTRELTYDWSAWSDWSDTPVVALETREVNTRTMVQYRIN